MKVVILIPLKKILDKLDTIFTPQVQRINPVNLTKRHGHRVRSGDNAWQDVAAIDGTTTSLIRCFTESMNSIDYRGREWNLGPFALFRTRNIGKHSHKESKLFTKYVVGINCAVECIHHPQELGI